ncbi:MAG: hypothetical protein J0L53_17325, partial [Spirochaetes bacterium]|nr:hypothetical protein [Spirochaetota bacterium]
MRRIPLFLVLLPVGGVIAQKTGEAAYQKALAYYEQKNYDACVTALKPAIKEGENTADLRILAAHCHSARKTYADAIYHLKAVLEDSSDRTSVRTDIVALLFQQARYREARNAGYKYIEAFKDEDKPVPHELSLWTAKACLAHGKVSEALAL